MDLESNDNLSKVVAGGQGHSPEEVLESAAFVFTSTLIAGAGILVSLGFALGQIFGGNWMSSIFCCLASSFFYYLGRVRQQRLNKKMKIKNAQSATSARRCRVYT